MTAEVIGTVLGDNESWKSATPWQRGAFAAEMVHKQYGWDALTQAWGWFLAGWQANAIYN